MEKLSFSGLGQWILEEIGLLEKAAPRAARVAEFAQQVMDAHAAGLPTPSLTPPRTSIIRDPSIGNKPTTLSTADRETRQKTAAQEAKVVRQYTGEVASPKAPQGLEFPTSRLITARRTDTYDPKKITQEPTFSRHHVVMDGNVIGSVDVDHHHQVSKVDTKHPHTNKEVMAALANKNNTPEEKARWIKDQNIIQAHEQHIKQRSASGRRDPNITIKLDPEHIKHLSPEAAAKYTKLLHQEVGVHLKSKQFKQDVNGHSEEANAAAQAAHAEEMKAKGKVLGLGTQEGAASAGEETKLRQATQNASTANVAPETAEPTPQKPASQWVTEGEDISPTAPMSPVAPGVKFDRAARARTQNAPAKAQREQQDQNLASGIASTAPKSDDPRAKFHDTLNALKDLHQHYIEKGASPHDIKAIQDHIDEHMKNWDKYNPQTTFESTPAPTAEDKSKMFEMNLDDAGTPAPASTKDKTAPVYFDPSDPEKV